MNLGKEKAVTEEGVPCVNHCRYVTDTGICMTFCHKCLKFSITLPRSTHETALFIHRGVLEVKNGAHQQNCQCWRVRDGNEDLDNEGK